jgi:hypothetical protein
VLCGVNIQFKISKASADTPPMGNSVKEKRKDLRSCIMQGIGHRYSKIRKYPKSKNLSDPSTSDKGHQTVI